MYNKHIIRNIAIIVSILLISSCANKNSENASDSMGDSTDLPTVMDTSDTVAITDSMRDSVEVDHSYADARLLRNKFANSEEALAYMKNSGNWDKYENGILPRMAKENLDYCGRLLANKHRRFIVCDKRRMKVILYNKYGQVEKEYGMVCGKAYGTKHSNGDCRTPEGFFSTGGTYDSREWKFTDANGVTHPEKGVFGPRFIRVMTPVTNSCGIHGAGKDSTLGKRLSHGCMRLKNECIMELVTLVEPGMPVIISPSERDMQVNIKEGYRVPAITTFGKSIDEELIAKRAQEELEAEKKAQEEEEVRLAAEQAAIADSIAAASENSVIVTDTIN